MSAPAAHSVDRQLGRMIALCGVLAVLAAWQRIGQQTPQFALWWSILAFILVGSIAVLAVVGNAIGPAALRIAWWTVIVGVAIAQSTIFLAFASQDVDELRPWVWVLEVVAMCLLGMLVPAPFAIGASFGLIAMPLLSGLVFLGRIPDSVLVMTPIHLGNIAVLGVLLGLRRRLGDLEQAGHRHQRLDKELIRTRARLRRQRELARMVHDDVLSVLTAASRVRGRPDATIRLGADAGLTALRATVRRRAFRRWREVEAADARRALASVAAGFIPAQRTSISVEAGTVPVPVLERTSRALAEALRNSVRHAPTGDARVSGRIGYDSVQVLVSDSGPGFEPDEPSPERLGLRMSILQRMRELAGGRAGVLSDSRGTRVDMGWSRSDADRSSAGLATGVARVALVLIWVTGVVHGMLLGRFPVVDTPIGVVTYAVALASAVLVTSTRPGALRPRRAAAVVAGTVLIAVSVLASVEVSGERAGEIWLLTFAGYLLGIIAARGNMPAAAIGAAITLAMLVAWGIGSHQETGDLAAMATPTAVSFMVGCAWCVAVALVVRRERSLRLAVQRAAAEVTAARRAHRDSERELSELRGMAEALLQRLASGSTVDESFGRDLSVAEGGIRDRIRSPSLARSALAVEIARARARGTQVVLLADDQADDGDAPVFAAELVEAVAALLAGHETAERITVRSHPAPSDLRLSVSCIEPGGDGSLTCFDSTGQIVKGQMSGT